jgi:DNA polymerase-3 subunit alpha
MTSDRDDISKLAKMIRECQAMGIAILPPDINESGKEFTAAVKGIRFAMTGIKGVGEGVVDAIIEERKQGGLYKSLYDFFKRIDTRKVGKKVVEVLIEAGCFDFTGWLREALIESVDPMYVAAAKEQKESARGIMNLFSLIEEDQETRFSKPPEVKEKFSKQRILKRENELLGFYLTGHPLDEFRSHLQRLSCVPVHYIIEKNESGVFRAAFIINSVDVKLSAKSQRKFAILMISDGGERVEIPIWPDLFEEKAHLIVENQLIYAVVQTEKQEGELKLQCRWLDDLTKVDEGMIQACDTAYDRAKMQLKMNSLKERKERSGEGGNKSTPSKPKEPKKELMAKLYLKMHTEQLRLSHILELKKLFRAYPGNTKIQIDLCASSMNKGMLEIDSAWGVDFHPKLEESLREIPGLQELRWEK